jgi:ribose/xylose/arabinose/galactoside ABC-type transport system permease subunit
MSSQTTAPPAATRAAPARLAQRLPRLETQLLLVLVAMWIAFSIISPDVFATSGTAENLARQAGILLVVAIGQMFALVVGGFDISVAANMGFVSTVAALRMTEYGGLWEGIVFGLAAGALIGLVNGIVIARLGVTPFVATLGMMTFLTGFANELSAGSSIAGLPEGFQSFGAGDWGPIPSSVGIAVIVLVIAWLVLSRLRLGLYIFAMGGSREASRVSGVPVVRYEILAYTICGLLAGVAGLMLASRVSVGQASLGSGYELLSIATAVIGGVAIGGGLGRLSGVVLGVALLTVLTTGLDIAGTNQFVQQMVIGAVLVGAVLLAKLRGMRLPGLKSVLAVRRPPAQS